MIRNRRLLLAAAGGLVIAVAGGAAALAWQDAGRDREAQLEAHSEQFFGVVSGLAASSTVDVDAATATADPLSLATLAKGLSARVVTSGNAASTLDMGALWPPDDPQYIISCNEQGTTAPGVQRINLATGVAETIVTGTTSCDPVHVTPWGTIIFGEEATDGHIYELSDPVGVTNATLNRITGVASTDKIVRRDALGAVAFEGVATLPSGVTYYGDELGPSNGASGGALYKFVPSRPWTGGTLGSLADSPFAAGTISVLRVSDGSNFGPGMSQGIGTWVRVTPDAATGSLRPAATAARATGFYRPEDYEPDGKALARGDVRICGNNTGREEANYFGETICFTDGTTAAALAGTSKPEVQLLVVGSPEFNMPDNIAYQPGRGNWIVHEDGNTGAGSARPHNNDLWSCLDDGADADLLSDGCLRIGSLNDLSAEWTGGFFDPSGQHFYVSVQHNKSGFGTILDITGWR